MDIFKEAAKKGLRFGTTKGPLSVEQLFQLTQTDLANAVKNQKKLLNKDNEDGLSFLDEASKVDTTEQLKFDILKEVYLTKKADAEALRDARAKKENNQRILELIAKKKEGALEGKSIEELEAMLAD